MKMDISSENASRDVYDAVEAASRQHGASFNNVVASLVYRCLSRSQQAGLSENDMDHRYLIQELDIDDKLTKSSLGCGPYSTNIKNIKKYNHEGELVYDVTIIKRPKSSKPKLDKTEKGKSETNEIDKGKNESVDLPKGEKQSKQNETSSSPKPQSFESKFCETKQTQDDVADFIDLDSDNGTEESQSKINSSSIHGSNLAPHKPCSESKGSTQSSNDAIVLCKCLQKNKGKDTDSTSQKTDKHAATKVTSNSESKSNHEEQVGDEVDYFDMDCDEIQESENESTDVYKDVKKAGDSANETDIEEITIISDDEDDVDGHSIEQKTKENLKTNGKNQPTEKQVKLKSGSIETVGGWKVEKIPLSNVMAVVSPKKSPPKNNKGRNKKKKDLQIKTEMKNEDVECIEIIDLDEDSNEIEAQTFSTPEKVTQNVEHGLESFQIVENISVNEASQVSRQIIEDMNNMIKRSETSRKQTPEDQMEDIDDIGNNKVSSDVKPISEGDTNITVTDQTHAAALGLLPSKNAAEGPIVVQQVSTPVQTISGETSQLLQTLMANQAIYVSSGQMQGSIPSLPPIQYLQKNDNTTVPLVHTPAGSAFVETDAFPQTMAITNVQSLQRGQGVHDQATLIINQPMFSQQGQATVLIGQNPSQVVISGEYTPQKKKRLLDFDKKWHETPKYSPEQDKYLALPGGIEGNSIASGSNPHLRPLHIDQHHWKQPGNYTSVSYYPSVPFVTFENVGDAATGHDYEDENEQYEDNSANENGDEKSGEKRSKRAVSRGAAQRGKGQERGKVRGRGRPRLETRDTGRNFTDSRRPRGRPRSVNTRSCGSGIKRGRGRGVTKGSARKSSSTKSVSPMRDSPTKPGRKIGFYSVKVGFTGRRGSSRGRRGASSSSVRGKRSNLKQSDLVTKCNIVAKSAEKRKPGRPPLAKNQHVKDSKAGPSTSSSRSRVVKSQTSAKTPQKTVISVNKRGTTKGKSLKTSYVHNLKECSVLLD